MTLDRIIAVRNNKTIYRDGELCIKVFSEDFSKADILSEALNQVRVEETGLNIPAVKSVTTIDAKWAIVSDYIEGKTLAQLMREHPEKKKEYMDMFVDLQLKVHRKNCPMLNRLRDKMNMKISRADIPEEKRSELKKKLAGMPNHNKLCHGDFNPSNIIIKDSGEAYITDWSHAALGNASEDAAVTYLLLMMSGDREGAEEYIKLFCAKSGTPCRYVRSWIPAAAASLLAGSNEEERRFLYSCI